MAKYAFNYDSGEYEYIERDGFSIPAELFCPDGWMNVFQTDTINLF